MTDTAEYETTERAGRRVAGQVVTAVGQVLTLTEAQAEHGLLEGTIVPKGKALHRSFAEGSKRLDGMRAVADAMRTRATLPPSVPDEPEDAEEPAQQEQPALPVGRGKGKGDAPADALKDA